MVDELRKIGLSDLEARCFLALHEEPKISGYEVAKRVSVSRTNVYAALRSLTERGICRAIEGDPVLYDAVPIEQLIKVLQYDFEKTTTKLSQELKTPPRPASSFYSWQGKEAVKKAIKRLILHAQNSIVVDIWSEDVQWVEEYLLDAEQRGVFVTLITIGESHSPLRHVHVHRRSDEWQNMQARRFTILCDSSFSLIGSFTTDTKLSALETDHPSVIELLQNAFYHDVIMERVERDFKEQFHNKYGKDYNMIIEPYRDKI
ncbi:TrmB family transcriptional regulator [Brevibacillus laterosporus]|uniref:TrmB family transcriptional regulator n=1 Tax=Brevibacillus laterosporus TaxID=1465 RepID=UPI00264F831E|nr:helix-turn-helix domain-containing protein [Brevibacillus laterosporus]MDN9011671.1 helix-turn-helix domain-containing protein [Brevibacillus laterosporus]MDO0942671.1 helix-turn-helix domain-containing protein [Brevibacillus laterosporus]